MEQRSCVYVRHLSVSALDIHSTAFKWVYRMAPCKYWYSLNLYLNYSSKIVAYYFSLLWRKLETSKGPHAISVLHHTSSCQHLESWKNAHAKQIAVIELYLTQQSPVCQLCWDDISKVVRNPAHTHTHLDGWKWRKGQAIVLLHVAGQFFYTQKLLLVSRHKHHNTEL